MASDLKEAGGLTRLFVAAALNSGAGLMLDEGQTHYLLHVLRAKAGDRVLLFNGRDGEWQAQIATANKRGVTLTVSARTALHADAPDLWLVFAPVKKTPSDYLAQKATELGVSKLQPVFSRRTIVTRINGERLMANAVEAAEQSGRMTVPEIGSVVALDKLIAAWPRDRALYFCDEGGDALPLADAARNTVTDAAAILTGPEGGFDPVEREILRAQPFVTPVSLGPRILRADTAALAAVTIWQSVKGDWR